MKGSMAGQKPPFISSIGSYFDYEEELCIKIDVKMVFLIATLFNMLIDQIAVQATEIAHYQCFGIICLPRDYDPFAVPEEYMKVYINLPSNQDSLRKVDDSEMIITFEVVLLLIWKDSRLRLPSNFTLEENRILSHAMLNRIWSPTITVENRIQRNQRDLGEKGTIRVPDAPLWSYRVFP